MAEIQEATQPDIAAPSIHVRLYAGEKKGRSKWKKLADKAAGIVITAGGIAVIVSIIAILFVIVAETLPLWKSPVAEQEKTITLNLAEGSGSQGRNRNARYFNALGSAREARACIHVALAWSYVEKVDADLLDELERVIATLVRLIV